MADWHGQAAESSFVMDYTALFTDGIGDLLERLDVEREGDVMDELMDGYDMPALMDMRLKVFRYAKAKLLGDLDGPNDMDVGPAVSRLIPQGDVGDANKIVTQWILVARRGKQRVVKDTMALMAYMAGRNAYFPHDVVRRIRTKAKQKGVNKRLHRELNQPKISFNVLEDEMDANGDAQDDSAADDVSGSSSSSDDGSSVENGDGNSHADEDDEHVDEDDEHVDEDDDHVDEADDGTITEVVPDSTVRDIAPGGAQSDILLESMDISNGIEQLNEGDQVSAPGNPVISVAADPPESPSATLPVAVVPNPPAATPIVTNKTHSVDRPQESPSVKLPVVVVLNPPAATPIVTNTTHSVGISREPEQGVSSVVSSQLTAVSVCSISNPTIPRHSPVSSEPTTSEPSRTVTPIVNSAFTCAQVRTPSVVMATQTEWDLWGSPGNISASSPTICPRSSDVDLRKERDEWRAACTEMLRHEWQEWRSVFESEYRAKDEQNDVKMTMLRKKQIESDNEAKRLRAEVQSLNQKLRECAAKQDSNQVPPFAMHPYQYMAAGYPPTMGFMNGWLPGSATPTTTQGIQDARRVQGPPMAMPPVTVSQGNQGGLDRRGTIPSVARSVNGSDFGRQFIANPVPSSSKQGPDVAGPTARNSCVQTVSTTDRSSESGGRASVGQSRGVAKATDPNVRDVNKQTTMREAARASTSGTSSANGPSNRASTSAARGDPVNVRVESYDSVKPPATGVVGQANLCGPTIVVDDVEASVSWAEEVISDAEMASISDVTAPPAHPERGGSQRAAPVGPGRPAAANAPTKVVVGPGPSAEDIVWSGGGYASSSARVGGESVVHDSTNNTAPGHRAEPETMAMIVTRNGWRPPNEGDSGNATMKRKQPMTNTSNATKVSRRVLEGGRNAPNRDIFVLNLEYTMCRDQDELISLVKEHCRAKGVGVVHVKVFTYEHDLSFANCRVTVKEFDELKVLERGFWPARASARAWLSNLEYRQRQRGGKQAEGENSNAV